ncbi:hypothetical protein GCM10027343_03300 [Noviherbaspirillum agri]
MHPIHPAQLVTQLGGTYSAELGIDLSDGSAAEIQQWFLAAILFGARISEELAERTYREFEHARLLTPKRIVDAGWDRLVEVLDRGGYARYDFKTATKLLEVNRALLHEYRGDLNLLHAAVSDPDDLERRLKGLGKGIGDVTVNIFLRELRGIWYKAAPLPSDRVVAAAQQLHYVSSRLRSRAHVLQELQQRWEQDGGDTRAFTDFEAALVRYGHTRRTQGRAAR